MDRIDRLQAQIDALAQQTAQSQQQTQALKAQTHTLARRLRWWRGLAGGLLVLAVLIWALPAGTAQEEAAQGGQRGLPQRVAALEDLLKHFTREGNEIIITGANLHIVNGLGQTDCGPEDEPIPDCPNGLGNLIVGYNELRNNPDSPDVRTGSHNVVVGRFHNFSRFGGIVVGDFNTISGDFASVSGGEFNTASGRWAMVSGGFANTASGTFAAVSGGEVNTANGDESVVSGGVVNTASDNFAVVSGGRENTASGLAAVVSGGQNRTAAGEFDWVAGALVEDE